MASPWDRYAPLGQMFRVNNHRLHVQHLHGDGPTILLESGQAGFCLDWMLVQPEVAHFAPVCSYDRAGLGWSETGPGPRSPQQIVVELHALLSAAHIPGPYVLVAHSQGGRYARLYAHLYPDEVVGMVLVDAYHEAFDLALGAEKLKRYVQSRNRQYRFFNALAHLGLARLLGGQLVGLLGSDFRAMPVLERKRYALLVTRPGAMATTVDEYEQVVAANPDFQHYTLRKDLPLRILTHGVPWPYPEYERLWQDAQRQAVTWSSRSKLLVAEQSGHTIPLGQPKLVIDSIREIVEEVTGK